MITFNWNELKKYSNNDIEKILSYFSNLYVLKGAMYDFLEKYKWARSVYNSPEKKDSYLLNVDSFIENDQGGTLDEQYVYLDIASKRDIFTYYNTKGSVIFVPYWKLEKYYSLHMLKNNRLLSIDTNNVYLIYEGEN